MSATFVSLRNMGEAKYWEERQTLQGTLVFQSEKSLKEKSKTYKCVTIYQCIIIKS